MSLSKFGKAVYIAVLLTIMGASLRDFIGLTFLGEHQDWEMSWRAKAGTIILPILAFLIILEILKGWKSKGNDK